MGITKYDVYLSVVIPAYNVAFSISQVIENISKLLDSEKMQYELIVVNDGSKDKTLLVLQDVKKKNINLNIISYEENRGKGYAVRMGVLRSRGRFVMFIDGDLDISPHSILEYINQLDNYDLVIASKLHPFSKTNIKFSRRILSNLFSFIVRFLINLKIKDTQVGLKIGNGEILRKIFNIMSIDGFTFDVELLLFASLLNVTIKEMPITMKISNKFNIKPIFQMFGDTLIIFYRYRIKHLYQKLVNTVSSKTY